VEETGVSLGWTGKGISYSTSGYWTEGPKTAVAPQAQGDFALLDAATRATVLAGPILPVENEKGRFGLLDFSAHQAPGRYFLQTPWGETPDFPIGERVMEEAAWKVLHFIYRQRCGCPIPNGHGACHGDIVAEHGGKKISYSGGWHDAGDVSQQTLQTGEVAQALLELARGVGGASRGTSPLLYRRLLEEARWGLDFVLRTRFGDGFRAFSAGNARWTNGVLGDFDDEPVRCHNRSFDNFLLSGVEAYAAAALREEDPSLSWACHNAAKEDYGFARARFDEAGMESKVKMEHTYNASLSQYYAAMCWAAALLYQLEPDPFYEGEAAKYGDLLLACQETGAAGLPLRGFFYREPQGKRIVHFNHQAREHLLAQALDAVWEALPGHPRRGAWGKGLALYGEYLAALYGHAAPYGMLPAGVHALDEPEDRETFELLHLYTTYEAEYENYKAQLGQGVPLGPGHCLRQFPVWFSFRGNNGVLLSAGKAAAVCAKYGCRERLRAAARDQLYWLAGKNPFGQSMIYGEGWGYARQYTALQGEAVGEIPVGVQTRGNEDVPYWPLATNATDKEVWMTSAGHWIRLLADVY
jgi:hypothetical protein